MHKNLMKMIGSTPYIEQVRIVESSTFDAEGTMCNVLIESPSLPDGYNGQQEMFIRDGEVFFRREADT